MTPSHGQAERRVAVTGLGIVCPLGRDADAVWAAVMGGRSGAARIEVEGLGELTACPVGELDAHERFGRREARRMDRCGQLAATAAGLALEDAGPLGLDPERVGGAVGSAHGGAETLYEAHRALLRSGVDAVSPFTVPLALLNTAATTVARVHGLRGPSLAPSTACAAGADAIGLATDHIRDGRADAMLAGGAEAPLSPLVLAGYRRLGALSRSRRPPAEASRPFDRDRDGFVVAEGSAVLVLEEYGHAVRRGARIHAVLAGYGSSCDAGHLTDPDRTGAVPANAMRRALEDAAVPASAVGYVNAHATATSVGDLAEARAIVAAGLGGARVSSTKSMHGHALGAAGAIEAVITVLAVSRGGLPPTTNLEHPEPDPPLAHVVAPEAARLEAALSSSLGFGGQNTALVFVRDGPELAHRGWNPAGGPA